MAGEQPSAEELQERLKKQGDTQNRGVGDQEPDPATAGSPPKDLKEGDEVRRPD